MGPPFVVRGFQVRFVKKVVLEVDFCLAYTVG